MITLKKQVEETLRADTESRNSDIRLTQMLWWKYYNSKIVELDDGSKAVRLRDLFELPKMSDIQRHRAHYQNTKHLFLPTKPEVLRQRKIQQEIWHDELQNDNPSKG